MPSDLMAHESATTSPATTPARRRRGLVPLAALAIAGLAAVGVVHEVGNLIPHIDRPLSTQVQTHSSTPLLLAAEDLHQLRGAQGTYQVTLTRDESTAYVPHWVAGEHTVFQATGTVDGLVDLSDLAGRVSLSPDGTMASFRLPAPVLGAARLDMANSAVVSRDRGIGTRIGGALAAEPVNDQQLMVDAERKVADAAAASDLRQRTERTTRDTLHALAESFGVQRVSVTFDALVRP